MQQEQKAAGVALQAEEPFEGAVSAGSCQESAFDATATGQAETSTLSLRSVTTS